MFNEEFWYDLEKEEISKSNLIALIKFLYISFEWKHNPFFRTQEQLLKQLNLNKMGLSRFLTTIKNLNISVKYTNKKYYFNLTDFFKIFDPIGNKTVTKTDVQA